MYRFVQIKLVLTQLMTQNHDAQVRVKWNGNDVAIWDNRCTSHCTTYDYGGSPRAGDRVALLGERPYLERHRSDGVKLSDHR